MAEAQGHKCAICELSFATIPSRNIHIDHDHTCENDDKKTTVRGILDFGCNAALGLFQSNPLIISNARNFLREFEEKKHEVLGMKCFKCKSFKRIDKFFQRGYWPEDIHRIKCAPTCYDCNPGEKQYSMKGSILLYKIKMTKLEAMVKSQNNQCAICYCDFGYDLLPQE